MLVMLTASHLLAPSAFAAAPTSTSHQKSCAATPLAAYKMLTGTRTQDAQSHNQTSNKHSKIAANTSIVNINRASIAELTTLDGIGAKRAQDIIDYRLTHGDFTSVEDLAHVKGIGDKTLAKFRHRLSVR